MKRPPAPETVVVPLAIPRELLTIVAPPPDTLSQRNVEAATGVPARKYLEMLLSPAFPLPVTREGHLRIVERRAFVAWLLARGESPRTSANDSAAAPPVEGEAALIAAMGLEPSPPRRRQGRG